ncbi:hypothetical protein AB4039_03910 [Streptomyces sp. M-16]|uniref:hypothetical protein n=1 Tax=Streptomyces sp. M-16 TaxID=3233040 RepID=UPI0022556373
MGTPTETTPLRSVALVRALSPSPQRSGSQSPAEQTMAPLSEHGVTGKMIRSADHDVEPREDRGHDQNPRREHRALARRLKAAAYPPPT